MDAKKILELRQKRENLIVESRKMLEAWGDKTEIDPVEKTTYERMDQEIDALSERVQQYERQLERERATGETGAETIETRTDATDPETEYRSKFNGWLRKTVTDHELRSHTMTTDTEGGYLLLPMQLSSEIIKAVDDQVFMRQFCKTMQLSGAQSLGVPTLDTRLSDYDWTVELGNPTADSMTFGRRQLTPHPAKKRVKVSEALLMNAPQGPESIVRAEIAYKRALTMEKAYLTGDGVAKPLGVFIANDNGISTSRDMSTDNTATAITADNLINNLYNLKPQHAARARWIFHRDAIKMIRKLKDGEGQYLWRSGLSNGGADTILEKPFVMSEFAPNTFTANLYVGLIGDFSYYWIVDSLMGGIKRINELYAETDEIGFFDKFWGDAAPVLEEAFSRVKLGS